MRQHTTLLVAISFAALVGLTGCLEGLDLGGITQRPSAPAPVASGAALQALGSVTEAPEGGVVVELAVTALVDGEPRYAAGVSDPRVRLGESEFPLFTTEVGGTFLTTSQMSPGLTYVAGGYYEFLFTLTLADGSSEEFHAVVQAPEGAPRVELSPQLIFYLGEPVELELIDMADGGQMRVWAPDGTLTWTTFGYAGPGTVGDGLSSLRQVRGPLASIPASAFPAPGIYTVDVMSFGLTAAPDANLTTPNLQAPSWFAAGTTRRLLVEIQ